MKMFAPPKHCVNFLLFINASDRKLLNTGPSTVDYWKEIYGIGSGKYVDWNIKPNRHLFYKDKFF